MTSTIGTARAALEERIATVRARIEDAARLAGQPAGRVTLVAVSKTVGRDAVDAAYAAGLRDFGENRIQDAVEKFAGDVPDDLVLHLIGSLQTNKARFVPGRFGLVHSLDRPSLAQELEKRCAHAGVVLPVLIQVNVAREEQKHGCLVEDVPALIEATLHCPHLELRGFMTMAPLVSTQEQARPIFVELRKLRDRLQGRYPEASMGELSMGMTNDYPAAIEEGATIIRVGRAIFDVTRDA
jgi:pyridoxal phosphate enzyme (YggS family)